MGWILIILVAIAVVGGGAIWYSTRGDAAAQTAIQTAADVAAVSKSGDVASIGVYVRDLSNNNVNTKVAVPVYCQGDDGSFIIDATSSSTTAEITGKTTVGTEITCWAFNSTVQSEPVTITVDDEVEHILIDSYEVAISGHTQFYSDTFATGTGCLVNITAGSDATGTISKMRYTNNNTDQWVPLGGFYFNIVEGSNVSEFDISGNAVLSGMDHASTQIVESDLAFKVSARKTLSEFTFEIDDSSEAGNQVLLMEENDYLETGSVSGTADGDGCIAANADDLIVAYAFTKGYYRSNKEDSIKYGAETDATQAAVISADMIGDTICCTG